jgi:hypothetical protein
MGVVIIERAVKRGNVRTFDEEYNRGFTDIWASEIDADFELLFSTWNESFQGLGDAIISPLAPTNPSPGDLWWRPTDGNLFVFYDDGNSKQFVPAISTGKFIGTGLPTGVVPAGGDLTGNYPAPVIAPLKVTTPKIGDAQVTDAKIATVSWAKVTGAPTSFPPSGPATGALTGTYPAPGVDYTKVTGAPTTLPPTGPAGAGGGALTGTYPNPGVDYTKITNLPVIPVVPAAMPPNGPAAGDLTSNYPNPLLRVGSTVKLAQPAALGSAMGLNSTETLVMQSSWTSLGGKYLAIANVHGHISIGPTPNGVSSRLLFDGTTQYPGDGYPLSSQVINSLQTGAAGTVVPFTIHHVVGGVAAPGFHFIKLTAFITGTLLSANGIDAANMMIFETT